MANRYSEVERISFPCHSVIARKPDGGYINIKADDNGHLMTSKEGGVSTLDMQKNISNTLERIEKIMGTQPTLKKQQAIIDNQAVTIVKLNTIINNINKYNDIVHVCGFASRVETKYCTISPQETPCLINGKFDPIEMSVVSSNVKDSKNSSGLRTLLFRGVGENGTVQEEELVLEGRTSAKTKRKYSSFIKLIGLSAGSSGRNNGIISVIGGDTSIGAIYPSRNESTCAFYEVPVNKIATSVSLLYSTDSDVHIRIQSKSRNRLWITRCNLSLKSGSGSLELKDFVFNSRDCIRLDAIDRRQKPTSTKHNLFADFKLILK